MASMSKEGPKRYRIQFMNVAGTGKRERLRLYNVTARQAETILGHVENIISACRQGVHLNDSDAAWLGGLPEPFYELLVSKGLAKPRPKETAEPAPDPVSLGTFLADFAKAGRTTDGRKASEGTQSKWRVVMTRLNEFFGADQELADLTYDDGYQFWQYLLDVRIRKTAENDEGVPLADNTVRKNIGMCKVFFNNAQRRGLINVNPFDNIVSRTAENRDRDYFVTAEVTNRIINTCPDPQWKLLVALWRYAGLRKTEPLHLTWSDVLWDQGRVRVHARKTAHHEGKDIRYVPLRDIRPYLDAVYFDPETVDGRIITRFSESNSNLDRPLKYIMHQAGVVPWPKLFNNMRASCETAWLDEGHPAHVVAAWIGHSVTVQRQNYAQVTDDHFDRFNAMGLPSGGGSHRGAELARTGEPTPD